MSDGVIVITPLLFIGLSYSLLITHLNVFFPAVVSGISIYGFLPLSNRVLYSYCYLASIVLLNVKCLIARPLFFQSTCLNGISYFALSLRTNPA
jgi:hypothetical protein